MRVDAHVQAGRRGECRRLAGSCPGMHFVYMCSRHVEKVLYVSDVRMCSSRCKCSRPQALRAGGKFHETTSSACAEILPGYCVTQCGCGLCGKCSRAARWPNRYPRNSRTKSLCQCHPKQPKSQNRSSIHTHARARFDGVCADGVLMASRLLVCMILSLKMQLTG